MCFFVETFLKLFPIEGEGISQELSLHPVHLSPDKDGLLPPSALVPFCSYQGDVDLLGQRRSDMGNLTVCDKFKPIILEGQLCYSIEVADFVKSKTNPTQWDNNNDGLLLLLDPKPYPLTPSDIGAQRKKQDSSKVYIHTLAQHTAYGPGSYGMHALKSLVSTDNFLQLLDGEKKCRVHNQEECQAGKYLHQVISNCSCIPWPLGNERTDEKVCIAYRNICNYFAQAHNFCGPESETCVEKQKVKNGECLVPCTGLYSDTSDDFLEQKTMQGEIKSFFVKNHSLIYFFRISITG